MWNEPINPLFLRSISPDLALVLEDLDIQLKLDSLGITYRHRSLKKSTYFIVPLTSGFSLKISPIDKGSDSFAEWYTWHPHHESEDSEYELRSSIRAYCEFMQSTENKFEVVAAFTHHDQDVETLIRHAISRFINTSRNLSPIALPTKKVGGSK